MKNQILNKCVVRKQGSLYLMANSDGKDVLYYNADEIYRGYPYQISVNTDYFNDALINYCERKLNESDLNEKIIRFYLKILYERFVKQTGYGIFQLDNMIVDKEGKCKIILLNYYLKQYKAFFQMPWTNVKKNVPYSQKYNFREFCFLQRAVSESDRTKEAIEINRSHFECSLVTDDLKSAYVEEYNPNNIFYFEAAKKDEDCYEFIKEVYSMFSNGELKMFFFK